MPNTLLEQCNADVFKAMLEVKEKNPTIGEKLLDILQSQTWHGDLTLADIMWFSAHLPHDLWNCKIHTFHLLFQSQQITTPMS